MLLLPKFFLDCTPVPPSAVLSEIRERNLYLEQVFTIEDWQRTSGIRPSPPALTLQELQALGAA